MMMRRPSGRIQQVIWRLYGGRINVRSYAFHRTGSRLADDQRIGALADELQGVQKWEQTLKVRVTGYFLQRKPKAH
jgi:hypothetical protein